MSYSSTLIDGSTKEYLSAAETAALVRKALAKSFPGVKFYVRSETYSGGASIDVYYDGIGDLVLRSDGIVDWSATKYKPGMPTRPEVEKVTSRYAGGGFDGMIDLAYYVDSYLDADGNVVARTSSGTEGSRGSVPAWSEPIPVGARKVSFGAKYIFVNHELPYDVRSKKKGA